MKLGSSTRTAALALGTSAVMMAATSVPASAYPTTSPLWGPTGLGTIPTADTVPPRSAEVSLGYEKVEPEPGGKVRFFPVVTGTFGLSRFEAGAGYLKEKVRDTGFALDSDFKAYHAKYRVYQNAKKTRGLAIGAHHLDLDDNGGGSVNSFYAVGSFPLGKSRDRRETIRGHLGVMHNRIRNGISTEETRPMAGLEVGTPEGITLAADVIARKGDAQRAWSVTVRYERPSGWGIQAGFGELQRDTKIFASVKYRFGGRRGNA